MRAGVRATAAVAVLLAAGVSVAPASAVTPAPKILSFTASLKRVPAAGSGVRLTARVANATRCTFTGAGSAFASSARTVTVGCAAGHATVTVHVLPNAVQRATAVRVTLRAISGTRSVLRTIALTQVAAQGESNATNPPVAPLQITTTALTSGTVGHTYADSLAAVGGTAPYTWTVSSGSLPAGVTLAANGTLSGSPTRSGQSQFVAEVSDAAGLTATASLSITVAATTVTVADAQTSTNWSGYSLDGSGFTRASGTFNVPTLSNTFGSATTSEWVGIDGDTPGNENLIQAGIAQDYDFSGLDTYAWWEILPDAETRIDTVDVHAGDSVTVTIAEVSAGSWSISLVDNTNGQSFTTVQAYNGAGESAEWIVEAPTVGRGRIATLGSYTPNVTFTGMSWTGSGTVFNPISLSQRGGTVSVPSTLSPSQTSFTVGYGSSVPAAPSG
ncbi:MAG TPA: G1 family glutamic endopeptidase [Gaiellaceae bacterium]|nr:G1 family glutamic endopeptidase [Gaiellaceae bacterium]